MNNGIRIGKYAILDYLFYITVKWHEFVSICGVGFGGFVLVFRFKVEIPLMAILPPSN